MSLIKLFFEDLELDYKKETLSLKRENNALSSEFTATYSSFPFLIIENEKSLRALGSSDITSINKKKIIPVTVIAFGVKFYGELQQLSVIKGYRKCNLKYSSDILQIISKKIADFMPVVSVIPGETNPIPFDQDGNLDITTNAHWKTYPVGFVGKIFPEVKWQFPTMKWTNKYGDNLDTSDKWFPYMGWINRFDTENNATIFTTNFISLDSQNAIVINNLNVASPQVYLLSPLYYFCQQIGYTFKGNFVESPFVKRLLFWSSKDNLQDSYVTLKTSTVLTLPAFTLISATNTYYSLLSLKPTVAGKYIFSLRFVEPLYTTTNQTNPDKVFRAVFQGLDYGYFKHTPQKPASIYEFDFTIEVTDADIALDVSIHFGYNNVTNVFPEYSLKYKINTLETNYQKMHPTIETGRYVPDWTVGNYLNYLKNQFNLDIDIDDFKKEITLQLNETIENTEVPLIINKSLAVKSYDLAANSTFILKYANSEDAALYINRDEVVLYTNQDDDFTQKIQSEFKFIPHNGVTSELSSNVEDKEGVGLLIYDAANAPYTSASFNGLNLKIDETGGIYQTYWKRWLRFLLNASNCQITGYFTETEIAKIYQSKSVYIDNQRYRIVSIEHSEVSNNYSEVVMELSSVNY